jgi:type VI secretion system protein ImpH
VRTTKRQLGSSVVQRLFDEPYRFEFFQAVRLVLGFLMKQGISEERAFGQVLRFESSTRLSFPASEVEALTAGGDFEARTGEMLVTAAKDPATLHIHITPAFIGFLGTCGVLPFHYSDRIATSRNRERNEGIRAFMNMFSNRLSGQFYLAWKKYRLEHAIQPNGSDKQLSILLSLAGRSRVGTPDDYALAYYAALFRTRPASGHAISRALTEYLQVLIRLEECVGSWSELRPALQSRLGSPSPRLGFGIALGKRLWRHDRRVRIHVGPLDNEGIAKFLPRSDGATALQKMLMLFDVGPIEIEIRLALQRECVRPLKLTTNRAKAKGGLGWTTFLTSQIEAVKKPEVHYMLELE